MTTFSKVFIIQRFHCTNNTVFVVVVLEVVHEGGLLGSSKTHTLHTYVSIY